MTIISTTVPKNPIEEMEYPHVNKESKMQYLGNLKNDKCSVLSICFKGKPCSITVIQVSAPTTEAEGAEVEQLFEDLQDLELTSKKDVHLIIGS